MYLYNLYETRITYLHVTQDSFMDHTLQNNKRNILKKQETFASREQVIYDKYDVPILNLFKF